MPTSYKPVRRSFSFARRNPKRRRSNVLVIGGVKRREHRSRGWGPSGKGGFSKPGGYVADRGGSYTPSGRRRKPGVKAPRANLKRRRRARARRSNPMIRRRRRTSLVRRNPRRRRTSLARRRNPRRRRYALRRSNPVRRRRRRSNPFGLRRRRRSNPFGLRRRRRRNPFSIAGAKSNIRSIFSFKTVAQVAGGIAGITVATAGPKLLASTLGMPSLQRGWGGVATSFGTGILTSMLVGSFAPTLGANLLGGSLIGSGLLTLAAIFGRQTMADYIPIEEALLAVSVPTTPTRASASQLQSAAQAVMNQQLSLVQGYQGQQGYIAPNQLVRKHGQGSYYTPGANSAVAAQKSFYGRTQGF